MAASNNNGNYQIPKWFITLHSIALGLMIPSLLGAVGWAWRTDTNLTEINATLTMHSSVLIKVDDWQDERNELKSEIESLKIRVEYLMKELNELKTSYSLFNQYINRTVYAPYLFNYRYSAYG